MNFLSEESTWQDHPSGDSYLNEFAEVLLEPQFQRLESEYQLSQKLLLVCSLFLDLSADSYVLCTIEKFN